MSRWVIRALVSAVLAAILLKVVPFAALVAALRRVSVWTWASSLAIFLTGHWLNALKLRLLLGQPSVPATMCVQAQYAGLVANLGLPGIAGGDLVRAGYLAPTAGTARVAVASIADRLIDTFTLLILVVAALPFAGMPPVIARIVWTSGWWLAVASVAGVIVGGVVFYLRHRIPIISKILNKLSFLTSSPGAIIGAVANSVTVQAAFTMTNARLAQELGVNTALAPWFVSWPLSKLVAVLPISLGGLGVREAVLVSILGQYGAPANAVLASGILWQSVLAVSGLLGLAVSQLLKVETPLAASSRAAKEA
jgi:uncharacterized membrane protein YbhN (UPF0104 family)